MVIGSIGTASARPSPLDPLGKLAKALTASQSKEIQPYIRFTAPRSSVAAEPNTATLDVPGAGGAFAVPYVQASSDLHYGLTLNGPPGQTIVDVFLDQGTPGQRVQRLRGPDYSGTFPNLAFGEHTLDALMYPPDEAFFAPFALMRPPVATTHLGHVGRGDVIVAIGDSVTEGLSGGPYPPGALDHLGYFPDWVAARNALGAIAPDMVSGDGREFPQAGASLHPASRPGFVVPLGQLLAAERGHPVVVINEGWSGITADGFDQVSGSQHFHDLVSATEPNGWLINLGANDVKVGRPAAEYQARLATLVGNLNRLGAPGSSIRLACPSFRKVAQQEKKDLEVSYLPVVDGLRTQYGLAPAPDLFGHYRDTPSQLVDEVHPSAAGYTAMAQLWDQALAGHGSVCTPPAPPPAA